jgi:hypothetical protein
LVPTTLADAARELAVVSARAGATLTVATSEYAATAGAPTRDSALAALDAARSVGDHVLESSALDALAAAALFTGDVAEAHRIAQRRLARVAGWRDDPAVGLELKDALHVATFCALAAGDLPTATSPALRHQELPFLRERRDLADDELEAPAALAGDWAAAVGTGERLLADWTAAGRPVAPGRGLAPAAVALAHGLLGDEEARAAWLDVVARIRGVPLEDANRGSGFGELFEALVHLHEGRPEAASDALAEADSGGLFARVFGPWIAAARAEAAVLARSPDAPALLAAAVAATRGNRVAAAMTARAAALHRDDRAALAPLADALQRAGAAYQAGAHEAARPGALELRHDARVARATERRGSERALSRTRNMTIAPAQRT